MKSARTSSPIGIFSLIIAIVLLVLLLGEYIDPGLLQIPSFVQKYLSLYSNSEPAPTAAEIPIIPTEPATIFWLDYLNEMRVQSGLAVVTENTNWNQACRLHSRYMVKNDIIAHHEDADKSWFTPDGDAAAGNGNLMASSDTQFSDHDAIAFWMSEPFHGIGIIDPQLDAVGFGSYRESIGTWKMAATLNINSGTTYTEPPSGTYPLMWPPDGFTTPILSSGGTEWPDPLTSCPGFKAPSGPPIYLQIGSGGLTPDVTDTSFQENGILLEHCVFDETSYVNPGTNGEEEIGRGSLNSRDAIILIPEQPLTPGANYQVSITSNGDTYVWQFTAGSNGQ